MHLDGHQSNHDFRLLTRCNVYAAFLELKLETAHNSHMHRPGWNCNFGHSLGIEIVRFKPTFGAIETIVGVHPSVVWPVSPTVLCRNENPRCYRRPAWIRDMQTHFSHRPRVPSLASHTFALCTSGDRLNQQRCIAATVRNECDLGTVWRPSRICIVVVSIGNGKRVATGRWHHPKLVPRPSQIGCVHNAFAVGRKVRTRLPGCLFVVDLVRFGAWLRFHSPESAGTVDVATIRNEQDFRAVAGPHRTDFVVDLAVVIPRK